MSNISPRMPGSMEFKDSNPGNKPLPMPERIGKMSRFQYIGTVNGYPTWQAECDCGRAVCRRTDVLRRAERKALNIGCGQCDEPKRLDTPERLMLAYSVARRVHARTGISLDQFCASTSTKVPLAITARWEHWAILAGEYKWSTVEIAAVTGFEKSGIYRGIQKYRIQQ